MPLSGRERFLQLRSGGPVILPSLLLCDFGNLEREIRSVEEAGARAVHLDIMDGHFVPNLTYGLTIVEAVSRITELVVDVHLMISNPGEYLDRYIAAGADVLTIHREVVDDPAPLLSHIREAGVGSGIAINPGTPAESIEDVLPLCDLILAMSVEPGFGGQKLDERALEKLSWLRERAPEDTLLEIDGGVNAGTIADCTAAGARLLVVGSAIFRKEDYKAAMDELNSLAAV